MVTKHSIALSLFLLSLILLGCEKDTPPEIKTSAEKSLPANVVAECDDGLYPAIYHLPHTSGLFSDDSKWAGQPVTAFESMLTQEEKEQLVIKLNQLHDTLANDEYRAELVQNLRQWCSAYRYYQIYSESMSTEELLAEWYSSPEYRQIFDEYKSLPMFEAEETDPIDKIASLSSAQSHQLIADWITLVAQYPASEFQYRVSGEPQ